MAKRFFVRPAVALVTVVAALGLVASRAAADGRSGAGYWLVDASGGVTAIGDAPQLGSLGPAVAPGLVIGLAPKPGGQGYWLASSNGGVFTFGDAQFYGSAGNLALRAPIVAIAATPSGRGYWLVASDGGIFAFGDAHFYGSAAAFALRAPIVGIAPTRSGRGYWVVASDGGIFAFGDAHFYGSAAAFALGAPIVGIAPTHRGRGYWLAGRDGAVFSFGDARFNGSPAGSGFGGVPAFAISAIAASPFGSGYILEMAGTQGPDDASARLWVGGTGSSCGVVVTVGVTPRIPGPPPRGPRAVGFGVASDPAVVAGELAAVACEQPRRTAQDGFSGSFAATMPWHIDVATAADQPCLVRVYGSGSINAFPIVAAGGNDALSNPPSGPYRIQLRRAMNPQHYSQFSVNVSTEAASCLVVARPGTGGTTTVPFATRVGGDTLPFSTAGTLHVAITPVAGVSCQFELRRNSDGALVTRGSGLGNSFTLQEPAGSYWVHSASGCTVHVT